jgi:putative transposase
MARLPRVDLVGVPQHIIQRGNNRQVCFASEQDFAVYASWLKEYSEKFLVDVHAWVFMTNHVHLLCTPRQSKAISHLMQSLGRRYVQYFNYTYKRSGTLWEGRYKSCLVQEDNYLLQLYRYIELNPVRAMMVDDPAHYVWSSYQINALGKKSDLCTFHPVYLSLANNSDNRYQTYRDLFKFHVDGELLSDIRNALNKGLAIGNDKFKAQIEELSGRRVTEGKRGRPAR